MIYELPFDETDEDLKTGFEIIMGVKRFVKGNFSGYWELAWLPVCGGMLDQPLELMEEIEMVINIVNGFKYEKEKKGGN